MMALVSIIIPCFNYGWVLAETLDSVLAQTHLLWECIIVDDGSTDSTKEVAEMYTAKDSRFRYVYQSNGGMSAARNRGLEMAKGEYIQFLDADDLLASRKIETQVEILATHPEYDLVYGGVRYFRHNEPGKFSRSFDMLDSHWQLELRGQGDLIIEPMVVRNVMVMNAPLLRSSLIRKVGLFEVGMHSMEDWDFWLRCALAGAYFHYDDRPEMWAMVRIHPTSVSQNRARMRLYEQNVRHRLVSPLSKTGLSESQRLNSMWLQQLQYEQGVHEMVNGRLVHGASTLWHLARESGKYLPYSKILMVNLLKRILK